MRPTYGHPTVGEPHVPVRSGDDPHRGGVAEPVQGHRAGGRDPPDSAVVVGEPHVPLAAGGDPMWRDVNPGWGGGELGHDARRGDPPDPGCPSPR